MATPKLETSLLTCNDKIDRLKAIKDDCQDLDGKYQHYISEMIMLRLFAIFEEGISEIACKIAAGAAYLNSNTASLSINARSCADARLLFLNHNRGRPKSNLKWTKASYIKESVEHVIPATEFFSINIDIHGTLINDMRVTRNVLAHRTSSAKRDFRQLVRRVYGAHLNLTPGAFLASRKRQTPANIDKYLSSTKIILNDVCKGHL